jgi:uncharacterized protein YndB with AHSA1/START domain
MERKTKINAENGKQEMSITREFELPVELLFKAHAEADIVEQWMSHEYGTTKVIKLESRKHGSWQYETTDVQGKVAMRAGGVIHEFVPDTRITRTFEMENSPFGVQLELYTFEKLSDDTSKLSMHVIFESVEQRDQLLKLPFSQGLNMAHNRLQDILSKLK